MSPDSYPSSLRDVVKSETFGEDPSTDVKAVSEALNQDIVAQQIFWEKETSIPYASLRAALAVLDGLSAGGDDNDDEGGPRTKRARKNTVNEGDRFDIDEW